MVLTDAATDRGSSARARLPSLLVELNGGKPLDLSVLAAISADTESLSFPSSHPHAANLAEITTSLFRDHAGESPEVLVGNGLRHARDDLQRTVHDANQKRRDEYYSVGQEDWKWYDHPENSKFGGPRTEGWVWVELFLGKQRQVQLLGESDEDRPMETDSDGESNRRPNIRALYWDDVANRERVDRERSDAIKAAERAKIVLEALEREAANLTDLDLLSNILSCVLERSLNSSREQLLRFAILYGLDGAVKEVLRGKYGKVAGGLSINSLLPLDTEPLEGSANRMFMPAFALGAILGHVNIVKAALSDDLGGEMDVPMGVQSKEDREMQINHDHTLPSHVFLWAFSKNMPEMISWLVKECGYQFRWTRGRHIDYIFDRLFDPDQWEVHPKYRGDLEEPDFRSEKTCAGRRAMVRMQATSAYRPQMQMLDFLIGLGFPFELFFPRDPRLELEERLYEEGKLDGQRECQNYVMGLPEDVRLVRARVHKACSAYNWIQGEEPRTMTCVDFYRALKSRWNGQVCPQIVCSPKKAKEGALDSMWTKSDIPPDGIIHDPPFPTGPWLVMMRL